MSTDPTAATIEQNAADDDDRRRARIREAWTAYHAEHAKPLNNRRVIGEDGRTYEIDDNVILGWSGDALDTSVHWLFGEEGAPLQVTLDNGNEQDTAAAQTWLDTVLENSGGPLLELELATLGGITGHAIIRINTLNAGAVPPATFRYRPELIELAVLDSSDVDATWTPRNVHRATSWVATFRTDAAAKGADKRAGLERHTFTPDDPDRPTRWEIIVDRTDKAGRWLRIGQPTIWPWPWPPIVDAQNLPAPGQFWGRSDIDAVNIALTRAGIARASDLNRTARIHAHPTVTAKGMTPAQVQNIDLGNDKITALPGPDMSLDYVELPEGASTSVGWLGELHDQFREHSRVPAVAAGRLDAAGALSGVALRILFAPLLQSTSQKRLTYGRLIRDLTRRLLALGGWQGTVTVQWPDILPTNDLEVWQTASAEQAAGVSRETSLRSRGLDPDQEEQNRAEEAARAANRMTEPYTDPAGDAPQDPPTDPQPAPGA